VVPDVHGLVPDERKIVERGFSPYDPAVSADDDGRPLPEGVLPAFRQREELLKHLGDAPIGVHLDIEQVLSILDAARKALWAAQPARICMHNPGEESHCDLCGGYGWLPQARTM
jgi:hypothetical protein